MRRLPAMLAVATALLTLGVAAPPARAEAPQTPHLRFVDFSRHWDDDGRDPEWWLTVDTWDPDGVVWEVQVDFGDRSATVASTWCAQGDRPGAHAVLRIPHRYARPGTYEVRARVSSFPRCPTRGRRQHPEASDWYTAKVLVDEPPPS